MPEEKPQDSDGDQAEVASGAPSPNDGVRPAAEDRAPPEQVEIAESTEEADRHGHDDAPTPATSDESENGGGGRYAAEGRKRLPDWLRGTGAVRRCFVAARQ